MRNSIVVDPLDWPLHQVFILTPRSRRLYLIFRHSLGFDPSDGFFVGFEILVDVFAFSYAGVDLGPRFIRSNDVSTLNESFQERG